MSVSILICTIIFYILSLVSALLLSMSSEKIKKERLKQAIILHFVFFCTAIIIYFFASRDAIYHSLFLATICSGVAVSGWAMRNKYVSVPVKIYFGSYLISILLFLYSPSLLFYLISGNIEKFSANQEIKLKENCYLVRQQSMLGLTDENVRYKVIEKYGIYNKTIIRNLNFTKKIDSVHIITFTNDTVILRGYLPTNDSSDVGFKPGMKENTITVRPSKKTSV